MAGSGLAELVLANQLPDEWRTGTSVDEALRLLIGRQRLSAQRPELSLRQPCRTGDRLRRRAAPLRQRQSAGSVQGTPAVADRHGCTACADGGTHLSPPWRAASAGTVRRPAIWRRHGHPSDRRRILTRELCREHGIPHTLPLGSVTRSAWHDDRKSAADGLSLIDLPLRVPRRPVAR